LAVVLCLSASTTCAQLSPNAGPSIARQLINTIIINLITSYGANYAYDQTLGKNLPTPSGTSILQATVEFKTYKETRKTTVRRVDGSLIFERTHISRIDETSIRGDPTTKFLEIEKMRYRSDDNEETTGYSREPFAPETIGNFHTNCKENGPEKALREVDWTVSTKLRVFLLSRNNYLLEKMFPGVRVGVFERHRTLSNHCDVSSNPERALTHLVWVDYNYAADLPFPYPGDMTTEHSVFGIYGSSYTKLSLQNPTM
jgi:hypothetical protein